MRNGFYNLLWKSHFLAGIVVVPFVILLSVTGIIYLFKDNYDKSLLQNYYTYESTGKRLSYEQQLHIAQINWSKTPEAIVVSKKQNQSTQFTSGRFSHKSSMYINPSNGAVLGKVNVSETDMHKVRKLHGELLLGSFGTKIVELVASWMFVLILSGIYLFWPRERGIKGLFTIRTKVSKRVFFRDVHTFLGFWFSFLLILILMGGFPWTDVFGSGYKWVQKTTNSGFPSTWQGRELVSKDNQSKAISLEVMIQKAEALNLDGEVSLSFPKSSKGVYTVSNQTTNFSQMKSIHFDQYTGEIIAQNSWVDIGFMMKSRLWLMAFHQGSFGMWNFLVILVTALALTVLSLAAIFSYYKRKGHQELKINEKLKISIAPTIGICLLGILLPLFGTSLIVIFFINNVFLVTKKIRHSKLKIS